LKKGFDVALRRNLTVAEYHHQYGAKVIEGKPNIRPPIICPACRGALHTVGEADLVDATWAHNPSKVFCPIKDSGKSKYNLLPPKAPAPAHAIAMRNGFFSNWKLHWSFSRSLADFAGVEDLIGFLHHADRVGLWGHATLRDWHLNLLKLKYRAPRSGVPTAGHYLDCELFGLDPTWQTSHVVVAPHPHALKEMHAAFPAELGPLPIRT